MRSERERFEDWHFLDWKLNNAVTDTVEFARELYERVYSHDHTSSIRDVEFKAWQAAKAQAVPEGYVLVSAEQMSQWGHMANYAEQYGCPECFEARGYAHSLACEINAYFNASEAQEPAND